MVQEEEFGALGFSELGNKRATISEDDKHAFALTKSRVDHGSVS
jgi:hypothetical protein